MECTKSCFRSFEACVKAQGCKATSYSSASIHSPTKIEFECPDASKIAAVRKACDADGNSCYLACQK